MRFQYTGLPWTMFLVSLQRWYEVRWNFSFPHQDWVWTLWSWIHALHHQNTLLGSAAIGPVIIALKKVIKDVLRIFLVFLLFLFSISIGMNYMLGILDAYCQDELGYNKTTGQYYNRTTNETHEIFTEPFDMEKVENKFRSLRTSLKTAMWSLFDPGHPEIIGCTKLLKFFWTFLLLDMRFVVFYDVILR